MNKRKMVGILSTTDECRKPKGETGDGSAGGKRGG